MNYLETTDNGKCNHGICGHPKLTETNNISGMTTDVSGQEGNVVGMFVWKKYTCDSCGKLITILQAVVEDVETK